jgi:putative membrane protein
MIRKWLISTVAVLLLAYFLPGIKVTPFWMAFLVALVFGVLNAFVRPVLIILTIPVNILSLGLFSFVINIIIVEITSFLVNGFYVQNFLWALAFSIGMSIVSGIIGMIWKK